LSGYYGGNIMRRTTVVFILVILLLMPITSMASVPQVSCKGGTCNNLKITKLVINSSSKTTPAKIGFESYIKGTVKLVEYTVVNSKTGKVAGYTRAYCSRCTKKGVCACTCIIKQPGTYDVKVTAYGSRNCCVKMVKKAAFTLK
jgi:hypothetical protein